MLSEGKNALELINEDSWLSNNDEAEQLITKYKEVLGDRFFLEMQHYDVFKDTYKPLIKLSNNEKIAVKLVERGMAL